MKKERKKTMNFVSARGGKKHQRDIAITTVHQMIAELLPRFRTLDIEVVFRTFSKKEGAVGFCGMTDDNRTFEIEIDSKMGINELVTTVCHEMVHVKQYARNQMTDECVQYGAATWKGRKVNPKTTYYDLPWEKEAYKLQDGLALQVWESGEI